LGTRTIFFSLLFVLVVLELGLIFTFFSFNDFFDDFIFSSKSLGTRHSFRYCDGLYFKLINLPQNRVSSWQVLVDEQIRTDLSRSERLQVFVNKPNQKLVSLGLNEASAQLLDKFLSSYELLVLQTLFGTA
jgi:hypothetical protein